MNGLPYYKAYPRDFMEATVGWPLELKGAYRLILDLIYMHNGRLPDDPRFISGHLGCSARAWGGYKNALIEKGQLALADGLLSNYRADNELIITRSFQDKQRQNGSQSKKNNALGEAVAKPKSNHTEPDTDSSSSSVAREAETAVGGSDADRLWADVIAAVGLQNGQRLPTHWMPPAATMHVQRWVSDLGLDHQQIIDVAKKNRAQHSEPPNGPKALDNAMKRLAGEISAPKLQPTQIEGGQNGQYRNDQSSGQPANRHGAVLTAGFAAVASRIGAGS